MKLASLLLLAAFVPQQTTPENFTIEDPAIGRPIFQCKRDSSNVLSNCVVEPGHTLDEVATLVLKERVAADHSKDFAELTASRNALLIVNATQQATIAQQAREIESLKGAKP